MADPRFGLGLRPPFYGEAARGEVAVDWFELLSENFMVPGGRPLRVLEEVRRNYPVALHGVSLDLGGTDSLDEAYLRDLAELVGRADPMWVSDHLCWARQGGHYMHDLLPLPHTGEAVEHVARRIGQVQERLGRRILIENISTYAQAWPADMPEWEFVCAVADRADCWILLDVNNLVVNSHNHGFAAADYIDAVPVDRVRQLHIAGHSVSGPLLIDTHDHSVSRAVWESYRRAARRFPEADVVLERDDAIPPLSELLSEVARARSAHQEALSA